MAVNLSPLGGAGAQFFDNNGVILSGGKIYTYAAGTSTPLTTYTSASGVTPHANPIILDSAGRVPGGQIWLTDTLSYKFVIETSASILLGTYDNITTAVDAAIVSYDPPFTGGVTTNVEDKLAQTVSVLDFGAVGDGVADDTAAIEAAINTGNEVSFVGPQYTYKITYTIDYTGKVTLSGNNATIKSDVICFNITNGDGSRIKGINFMPVTTPYTLLRNTLTWVNTAADVVQSLQGYQPSSLDFDIWSSLSPAIQNQTINKTINPGITFQAVPGATARTDVIISEISGYCILIQLNGYQNSTVENCNIGGGPREAIVFYNGSGTARGRGNSIRNNQIKYATQCGALWWGQDEICVMGNDSRRNGESGFKSYQYDGVNSLDVISMRDRVIGNNTQDNFYDGFDLQSWYLVADPVILTEKVVVGNTSHDNRATCFTLNGDGDTLVGNIANRAGSHGISFLCTQGSLSGNIARDCGLLPVAWGPVFDIFIQGNGIVSTGNTVSNVSAPSVWNYLHTARLGGSPITGNEGLDIGNYCSFGPTRVNISPNIPTARTNTTVKSVFGGTYTVDNIDTRLRFLTSGACVVTLPAPASSVGRQLELCTLNAFTITSASANVGPMANAVPNTALLAATVGAWCVIVSDGTSWQIMSQS